MRRRLVLALTALLGSVGAFLLVSASGATAANEAVQGQLRNAGQPVGGVKITVTTADGAAVGEATTGADGRWVVQLPRPGTYNVRLDKGTLPQGVSLRQGTRDELTVQVLTGQRKPVIFALGASTRQEAGQLSRAWALTVEGIRFGLIIALAALGLSVIFGTTGLTNFAHGELITFGALVAFLLNVTLGLPFLVAVLLTVVVAGIAGGLLDVVFWRWLRRRGTGLIAMMIVSIGLAILLRYVYLVLFQGGTRSYREFSGLNLDLGSVTLDQGDLFSVGLAIGVLALVSIALLRTRIGKATRAVADNPALAAASGIDVERVINIVWVVGTALAALSGVLLGLSQQVNYQMGFQILLLIFAAVTLGGLGTAFGAIVGSLVVGLFIQLSTLVIPSELKNVGALAVLIVVLLIRPQGILGRRERVG